MFSKIFKLFSQGQNFFFKCEDLVIKIWEWMYLMKKPRCIWIRMLLSKWFEPIVLNISLTATISGWFSLAHHMSWIKMWQLICKDAFQVISVFFSNNMEFYLSCCSWAHKKEEEIRCPTPISHLKDQFWLERPLKKNKWLVTLYYFILFAWEQKWFRLPRRNCDKCTT